MKNITTKIALFVLSFIGICKVQAQNQKLAIMHFDVLGITYSPADISRMVYLEMDKTDTFELVDKYELELVIKKNELSLNECYAKSCIVEVGEKLNADLALTGSIERFGEKIIYNMRLIDVKTEMVSKSVVMEFINQQSHLSKMTNIMINQLLDLPQRQQIVTELAYIDDPVISNTSKLNASGPRMGIAILTSGKTRDYLTSHDGYPVMSIFGYQQEVQYMSTGNFRALFEFVGIVSGMDQGLFIPSLTVLNGFRNAKSGLEFAFGPSIGVGLQDKSKSAISPIEKFPPSLSFVYAVGKTFQSGLLNIPVNAYVSPSKKEGWKIGISCGFNVSKRK